ncbi:erythromycin esterase family protein [Streptomyces sp. R-07]|uniref:erythromycin esterase family protein n=1 Tax=Streptomyces sp. R-07 TaxID=3404052 RepID=UPI003CE8C253
MVPERGPQATVGSLLREGHGGRYVSVAIGFHHGDLGIAVLPEPAAGLVDARLGRADLPAQWLDLRDEDTRRRWDGPAKARVINGAYTPARDAAEHLAVASLADAFDVLIQVRQASPVRRLQVSAPSEAEAATGRTGVRSSRRRSRSAGALGGGRPTDRRRRFGACEPRPRTDSRGERREDS